MQTETDNNSKQKTKNQRSLGIANCLPHSLPVSKSITTFLLSNNTTIDSGFYLTTRATEAVPTVTDEGAALIEAVASVKARIRVTGVDVALTVGACVPWGTVTGILVNPIPTCTSV